MRRAEAGNLGVGSFSCVPLFTEEFTWNRLCGREKRSCFIVDSAASKLGHSGL